MVRSIVNIIVCTYTCACDYTTMQHFALISIAILGFDSDQYFYEGYLEGGTEFLDRMMAEQLSSPQEQSVENKADLKPTTVAGIAGLGIFGAWLASRIKGGNN